MDWQIVLQEIVTDGARIAVLVPAIIIPLMVVLALLTDSRLLDRGVGFIQPVMQRLNLSNRVAFPLLAGLFFRNCFRLGGYHIDCQRRHPDQKRFDYCACLSGHLSQYY